MRRACCAACAPNVTELDRWANSLRHAPQTKLFVHPTALAVYQLAGFVGTPPSEIWVCQVCGWRAHTGPCQDPAPRDPFSAMMPAYPAGHRDFIRSPWRRYSDA